MRKGQIKEREKLFTRYVHIQIKVVLSLHQFWAQGVKMKVMQTFITISISTLM